MAGRKANSIYMLAGQVFGKAGLFVSLMIYSRILEDGAFGELLLSVSIGLVLLFLSDMGVTMLTTKKLSNGCRVNSTVTAALILRAVLSIGSLAIVTLLVKLAGYSSRQVILVLLVSGGFIVDGFCESVYSVFRAKERMIFEGTARLLHGILCTGLAVYAMATHRGVVFAGVTYIVRSLPSLVFAVAVLSWKLGFRPSFKNRTVKRIPILLKAALPLGIAGIIIASGQRLDGVFIKAFQGDAAIAAYQQCLKVFEALVLLVTPTLLPGALFPGLCKAVRNGWKQTERQIAWMTELFLAMAFMLVILFWTGSSQVLRTVWGASYLRGISAGETLNTYRMILLTLPVAYMFNIYMSTTIAAGRQRRIVPAVFFPLLLEIVLFIVLIPRLGITGAAAAHMVFMGSAAVWMSQDLRRAFGPTGFFRGSVRPVVSFLAAMVLLLAGPFSQIMNGAAAAAVFLIVWLTSGGHQVIRKFSR